MDFTLSGRWLIAIVLFLCMSMVLWALLQRSRDTGHVRAFWGAAGAACIQRAPQVKLWPSDDGSANDHDTSDQDDGRDISQAPGLIHLRATLVDDRYFRWPSQPRPNNPSPNELIGNEPAGNSSDAQPPKTVSRYRLQFVDGSTHVDVLLDLESGRVINLSTNQSVQLIESSRQALVTYLPLIVP